MLILRLRFSLRRKLFSILSCVVFFSSASVLASECDKLDTTQEVLNCALERHPEVRESNLAVEQSAQGRSIAAQRPNPELNSQGVYGGQSSNHSVTEINLSHTFELGGKRDSRLKRAEAEMNLSQAFRAQSRDQVYLGMLIALYRIRQIQEELGAMDDALRTFTRISKQYRSRSRLNPEQRASLRLFEVAEQDYKMKRATLETEKDFQLRTLEYAIGHDYVPKASVLPAKKTTWPSLPSNSSEASGAQVRAVEAELQKAKSEGEIAKSTGWPDVKLGPTVIMQRQGSQSYESYGFNLSLPLPLYHRNGAQVAAANAGIERATIALEAARHENSDQRAYLRKKYESAVKVLSEAPSAKEMNKKHEEVESLFTQGFLNGTVIVEIHRQASDFIKTQNEQEINAIESLVRYYALEGKLAEVQQ